MLAMPSLILMAVWQGAGWSMVIYLAGLQGIPDTLYEAAAIDGATVWQRFWHITLPLLAPVTSFVVIISGISALQVFSQIFIMTQGGPLNATTTVTHQIWTNAFRFFRMGFASAMSFLLFLVIVAISLLNNWLFGGSAEY
jgi:ABC-type sugar transport system permease subunit